MDLVCEECGETNRAGTEFCVFCGHFLPWGSDPAPATSPAAPVPPPPTRPSGPPAEAPDWRPPVHATTIADPAGAPTQQLPATTPAPTWSPALALQQNCPSCGRANDASRRFCAKCGHQLIPSPGRPLGRQVSTSRTRRWWERLWDTKDRSARRAYRRSLPPLLRWRRVLAGVLALVLVGGGAVLLQSPRAAAGSAVDQWYELRNRKRFVVVKGLQATLDPADPRAGAAKLVDSSRDAWTTAWDGGEGTDCRPAPGVPLVVLTFPQTRIRRMDFYSGLSEKLSDRPRQFRPRTLGVRFEGGPCRALSELGAQYENLDIEVDSGKPVTSMEIAVMTAYPPEGKGPQARLSIGEIGLDAHPRKVF